MPFLPPNQQRQSTEGHGFIVHILAKYFVVVSAFFCDGTSWYGVPENLTTG